MLVRDAEWLVTSVEQVSDGYFVDVIGLSELVRDTTATFSTALDKVVEVDPSRVRAVPDESPGFRRSRLWLEATCARPRWPSSTGLLSPARPGDHLDYQFEAVSKALDPDKLRPRILLADAVGLGKTMEIGMILSELVRRGRGDRILVVTPKQVLEQIQMELWTRFALPFVRLDSTGIQRIRRLPANRNPFTYYKRMIISIDTLKSDRYGAAPAKAVVGRGGGRRVAQRDQHRLAEQPAGPAAGRAHRRPDPRLGNPAQRQGRVVRRAGPHARPKRRQPVRRTRLGAGGQACDSPPPPPPRRGRRSGLGLGGTPTAAQHHRPGVPGRGRDRPRT